MNRHELSGLRAHGQHVTLRAMAGMHAGQFMGSTQAMTTFRPGNRRAAKLTPSQVLTIRERYAAGETQSRLARDFGMSVGHIGRIVRGEQWADYAQVPTDQELEHTMATGPQPTEQELADSMARLEALRTANVPAEPQIDLLEQVLKRRGGDDPLRRLPRNEETRNEDGQTDQSPLGQSSPAGVREDSLPRTASSGTEESDTGAEGADS